MAKWFHISEIRALFEISDFSVVFQHETFIHSVLAFSVLRNKLIPSSCPMPSQQPCKSATGNCKGRGPKEWVRLKQQATSTPLLTAANILNPLFSLNKAIQ